MRQRPAIFAALAIAFVWLWQFATVHANYGGNWTALFCLASDRPPPSFLSGENLYIFPNSLGYDGMQFHIVAHDPWMTRGGVEGVDNAALRYPRILVPGLAWLLALGRDSWIHPAYFTVILGFLFCGVYWSGALLETFALHPAWGMAFVLTPAAITSIDRMTVDVSLAALTVAFALYSRENGKMLAILALAALARETGLVLIGAFALYSLSRRDWRGVVVAVGASLPSLAWSAHVIARTGSYPAARFGGWIPLYGYLERWLRPQPYLVGGWQALGAQAFDYMALAGVGVMLAILAWVGVRREWSTTACAAYLLGLSVVFLADRSVWEDSFSFGRVLTPALILAAVEAIRQQRPLWGLAPILLIDARMALNFVRQLQGLLQW